MDSECVFGPLSPMLGHSDVFFFFFFFTFIVLEIVSTSGR